MCKSILIRPSWYTNHCYNSDIIYDNWFKINSFENIVAQICDSNWEINFKFHNLGWPKQTSYKLASYPKFGSPDGFKHPCTYSKLKTKMNRIFFIFLELQITNSGPFHTLKLTLYLLKIIKCVYSNIQYCNIISEGSSQVWLCSTT